MELRWNITLPRCRWAFMPARPGPPGPPPPPPPAPPPPPPSSCRPPPRYPPCTRPLRPQSVVTQWSPPWPSSTPTLQSGTGLDTPGYRPAGDPEEWCRAWGCSGTRVKGWTKHGWAFCSDHHDRWGWLKLGDPLPPHALDDQWAASRGSYSWSGRWSSPSEQYPPPSHGTPPARANPNPFPPLPLGLRNLLSPGAAGRP